MRKILVVDDEPDLEALMLQKFRRRIRAGELEFHFARNGYEALQRLREIPGIEMVLTDINMPEMDGLTLLGELGTFDQLLKAVVVSAYGDLANIRTAMNRGAFDFLTKPIDFGDLELTIAKTLEQMEAMRQGEQAKTALHAIHEEMEIAGALQQSILPRDFPHEADHSLYATMFPAREIGGDFYDFFYLDDRHLGIVMADVSGKGVTAAMFMAVSRTLLRFTALQGLDVGPCLAHVNNLLCADNESVMFVTLFYGILDLDTGELVFANAGHLAPYRITLDGRIDTLPLTRGVALGVMEGLEYHSDAIRLAPGDQLLLCTDGVPEACNAEGVFFSDDCLKNVLETGTFASPRALVETVAQEIRDFTGSAPLADDVTVLAVRFGG
jgi:phosphoserine phosphatase RsbU/P